MGCHSADPLLWEPAGCNPIVSTSQGQNQCGNWQQGRSRKRTMHDLEFHASVVGSNFRPLFHSSLPFPEFSEVWRPADQDGDYEGVLRG
jgi:hypothetical protein